jgi:membrane-bound serine protease (ClpP class)
MRSFLKTALAVTALTLIFLVDDVLLLALGGELAGWRIPFWLVSSLGFVVLGANLVVALLVYRFLKKKPLTGREGMVGVRGVALQAISPHAPGQVRVRGEIWRAESDQPIRSGEQIQVKGLQGLTLLVEPTNAESGRV